jgi:DNA-directed RNA polymerase specialized sigma24 family protein
MTEFIHLIEAQPDEPDSAIGATSIAELISPQQGQLSPQESSSRGSSWQDLPIDTFMARTVAADIEDLELGEEEDWDRDPDLWLYRRKTTALLRRYMQWSLEAGRVPSLLGRELFRARISAYTSTTFEARVIFLHDVEMCLGRLKGFDGQIVARILLQEYDHEAAARILQCDRKTIERRLPELIDLLSEAFLKAELIERLPETVEEAL